MVFYNIHNCIRASPSKPHLVLLLDKMSICRLYDTSCCKSLSSYQQGFFPITVLVVIVGPPHLYCFYIRILQMVHDYSFFKLFPGGHKPIK